MPVVGFNQDSTALQVCGENGYQLYTLEDVNKVSAVHHADHIHRYKLVERLYNTSLVIAVEKYFPRFLRVLHFKKDTEISILPLQSTISSAKLNRQVICVCLENEIRVYNTRNLHYMHTITTPSNYTGLFTLSNNEQCLIAYPAFESRGTVRIANCQTKEVLCTIDAHYAELVQLSFSSLANKIATASTKGTVIRVFSLPEGNKIHEFRRGLTRCVNISSLSFSPDCRFLCASSNTETVHVFKLDVDTILEKSDTGDESWTGYVTNALKSSLIPNSVSDVFNQWRAFSTAKLTSIPTDLTIARLVCQKSSLNLLVTSQDSQGCLLYVFILDREKGGVCELKKTIRLETTEDSEANLSNSSSSDLTCDASYAYKLQHENPTTTSQQLHEIVENATSLHSGGDQTASAERINLNNEKEFPPMCSLTSPTDKPAPVSLKTTKKKRQ